MTCVHLEVWCIDIKVAACREGRLSALLADEELEHANRFVRPADALRYRVAHGALRTILSGRTGIAPRHIRFSYGDHGKPFLSGGGPRFSLSHSGALALVAVSAEHDVGIDVEEVRAIPDARALAQRHVSPEAARAIADQPRSGRDVRFMRIWTAMEAIVKAEGTGLAEGLDSFEVRETGGDRARAWLAGAPHGPTWSVRWLAPAPGHVGAVAARGRHFTLRTRRFA